MKSLGSIKWKSFICTTFESYSSSFKLVFSNLQCISLHTKPCDLRNVPYSKVNKHRACGNEAFRICTVQHAKREAINPTDDNVTLFGQVFTGQTNCPRST